MPSEIVTDRGRSDSALAHRVADLIETQNYVARCIDAVDAGALMLVDCQAAIARHARSDLARKFRTDIRAKGGIKTVE